jgi:dipeptidyl-peptidase-4
MKTRILLLFIFIISISVFPQKKDLTLKQATLQSYGLYPRGLSQTEWIPGTNNFSYVDDNALIKGNVNNDKTEKITSLDELNDGLLSLKMEALSRLPSFEWMDENTIKFWAGNNLFNFNINTKTATSLNSIPEKAENKDEASNHFVAYTIDNNLYFAANGRSRQITKDDNKWVVNGQTVHRNEFGINKGTYWSPTGNYLAFYRMDESMENRRTKRPLFNRCNLEPR